MSEPATSVAYSRLAGVYDQMVVDPCYSQWADYLMRQWAADESGVRSVLDACCGTGILTEQLHDRGLHVVGFDAAPAMLDVARTRLGTDVPLLEGSLPDLALDGPLAGPFDAVISTFDGLNYLTPEQFTASITSLARVLRPGGWLAFDLHTDAMMHFIDDNSVVSGEEYGRRFTITNDVDVEARTIDTVIEMTGPTDADAFREHHRQYFHSDEAVRAALTEARLELIRHDDEYTEMPADDATVRATWLARKWIA